MRYMLLCYDDEQAWDKAGKTALKQAMDEAVQLTHELNANGQYVSRLRFTRRRWRPAFACATASRS